MKDLNATAGTAQALRDAGWSVTAIAKELRKTIYWVYEWTKAPEQRRSYPLEWMEQQPNYFGSPSRCSLMLAGKGGEITYVR